MKAIALLALVLAPALAAAEPAAPAPAALGPEASDCARARAAGRLCELTIDPEEVGGDVIRPDGDGGIARIFEALGSLFAPRRDFLREIVAAAQDVP